MLFIQNYRSAIGKLFEDDEDSKYAWLLSDLLATKRNKGRQLKSIIEIKKIYLNHKQLFDLKRFQQKFLQLIRSWVKLVLPIPTLSQFNYGADRNSGNRDAKKFNIVVDNKENSPSVAISVSARSPTRKRGVERSPTNSAAEEPIFNHSNDDENKHEPKARGDLKRKRNTLMKNVKDPLEHCVAEAQSARVCRDDDTDEERDVPKKRNRPIQTPSFRKEKASAHSLRFEDSDSDFSDEEGVKLSDIPKRYQSRSNPQEIQIGNFSIKKRRSKFTESEDNAIREGVDRFGAGKWTEIKVNYAVQLKGRDTIQIKDRWRTLNKQER